MSYLITTQSQRKLRPFFNIYLNWLKKDSYSPKYNFFLYSVFVFIIRHELKFKLYKFVNAPKTWRKVIKMKNRRITSRISNYHVISIGPNIAVIV